MSEQNPCKEILIQNDTMPMTGTDGRSLDRSDFGSFRRMIFNKVDHSIQTPKDGIWAFDVRNNSRIEDAFFLVSMLNDYTFEPMSEWYFTKEGKFISVTHLES